MRAIIAALLTSASLAAQSVAQVADRPVIRGALGTTLDQYLQRAALSGFSGVVLVEWHDTVVLHRAYGWLNARHLVPPTVATGFAISSNTKMFSGALTAVLASQGRLRLSDSIGRYLPDVPEDKRGITIHQLLTHSAGLADTYAAESSSTLDGVRRILATPLVHGIGERWEYSNDGFHLLEAILEVAGRKPIDALRRELLFTPAGMRSTGTDGSDVFWPTVAAGQNLLTGEADARRGASTATLGRVGLRSTAADLHRWSRAWRSGAVLGVAYRDSVARGWVPVRHGVAQAYGAFALTTPLGAAIRMGGNDTPAGNTSEYRLYTEANGFLAILNNSMWDATPYIRRVRDGIEAILQGVPPAPLPDVRAPMASDARALIGTYRAGSRATIVVWNHGTQLLIGAEGQDAIDVLLPPDSLYDRARRAAYTRRAATLLTRAMHGPSDPLLDDAVSAARRRIGDITAWDTLGTAPTPADDDATGTTYVRLRGRAAAATIRIVWSDSTIAFVLAGTPRPYLPLLRRADGAFVGHDFFAGRSTTLSVSSPSAERRAQSMRVGEAGEQTVFVRRQ